MEPFENLKSELKLLDNFMSRRNTSGIKKSMTKILENPARIHFSYKILANRSIIVQELKQNLAQLVSDYQNDQISIELIMKCIILGKCLDGSIQIGPLTPVCILCHSPCDPYSKKIPCCGYFAHIPCLEQISNPKNQYTCPKCSKTNLLVVEVKCQNCSKLILPEKTMVSACRHIVCNDCVSSAGSLAPSPYCFCCPYKLPFYSSYKLEDVKVLK
jgi:hypothetical protein